MIPIIPKQTSEDDRPMGLKFTRNNFFNFPKRDNNETSTNSSSSSSNTILKRTPSYNNNQRDSDTSSTISTSYQYQQPISSPTLPTRSPFRIRDSQQQQQLQKSHDTKSLDEPPSIYSSISSSSSTTSSSANTDDDLFVQELEGMWKLKTHYSKSSLQQQQQQQQPVKIDINSEDMLLQLLISHAVIDSRDYKVLTFEEYETLKQHHARLVNRVKNSTAKLELDKKIQETSHSLSNLSFNKNRESVMLLLDEAVEADRKVKILSQRLNELKSEQVDTQYQILQHTAGVLCLGLQKLESVPPTPTTPVTPITDNKVAILRAEIEAITNTLNKILKTNNKSTQQLLEQLENQLEKYKSTANLTEEKLKVEKKTTHKLQLEMNELLSKVTPKDTMDWLPKDDFNFNDDLNNEKEKLLEIELENGYKEIKKLKENILHLETASNEIQSKVAVFQSRENKLKLEMEQYRDEVFKLRQEQQQYEQVMKRQTVIQAIDGNSNINYEQQLEEQEQEYQAQLKEQAAFLDKTTRQCEQLKEEHDKLSSTCQDLELLVRDKQKALDARNIQVQKLESELQEQKLLSANKSVPTQQSAELLALQKQFTEKESAWIEQSNVMESNFEGILKEFDRLTGTAMEFETDKKNYERRIDELTREVKELESNLTEEKTKNLGYEGDTPTTASLRKEFRRMINDMKLDHQRTLEREGEEKKRLEKQLKDLKHEREMSNYERINKGVQTLFTL